MKRALANWLYRDPAHLALGRDPRDEHQPWRRDPFAEWRQPAHAMAGLKRLDNVQVCLEQVLAGPGGIRARSLERRSARRRRFPDWRVARPTPRDPRRALGSSLASTPFHTTAHFGSLHAVAYDAAPRFAAWERNVHKGRARDVHAHQIREQHAPRTAGAMTTLEYDYRTQ